MDIRKVLLVVLMFFGIVNVSEAQMQMSIDDIRRSQDYYSAEGVGASIDEADADALSKLVGQISVSVSVSSSLTTTDTEGALGGGEDYSSSVKTVSLSTLQNVGMKVLSMEPNARVLRYVLKSEVKKMFEEREKKIAGYIAAGKRAEQRLQLDDALKYYYWAFVLSSVHPYSVDCTFGGDTASCISMLPMKIKSIIGDIKVTVDEVEGDERLMTAELKFTYDEHDVASVKFRYFDGQSVIGPVAIRDGEGELEVVAGLPDDKVQLFWEYRYASDAKNVDLELGNIFASSAIPSIDVPITNVKVKLPETKAQEKARLKAEKRAAREAKKKNKKKNGGLSNFSTSGGLGVTVVKSDFSEVTDATNDLAAVEIAPERIVEKKIIEIENVEGDDADYYLDFMYEVENAVRSHNSALAKDCFTEDGYKLFRTLMTQTGQISIVGEPDYVLWDTESRVIVRGFNIKMKFNNGAVFMENLTFRFSKDSDKIESLAFALTQKAERDIFNAAAQWSQISRFHILNFMEDYQTAYALKREDYLESIFSDNAIIITGTVVKPTESTISYKETNQVNFDRGDDSKVKYTKLSKQEYLERLKLHFSSREYIHLTFEDNITKIVNTGGVLPEGAAFAIQISQAYSSPNYADKGYLSLLLNMQGKDPVIEVRLWEPNLGDYTALDQFISNFDF